MFVLIIFILLCVLTLVAVVGLFVDWYQKVWSRRTRFYDKEYCRRIISKYTGDEKIQVLRALTSGELHPSDIKRYYNCGEHNCRGVEEEYRLINRIDTSEYTVEEYLSGSNSSRLLCVEVNIVDGKGTIVKHWYCD